LNLGLVNTNPKLIHLNFSHSLVWIFLNSNAFILNALLYS